VRQEYYYLLFSAVLYGSISTVAKPALTNIHPILLSSVVYLIMGLSLLVVNVLSRNNYSINAKSFGLIVLVALFGGTLGPISYFMGLSLTNASFASILINAEFMFTIILAIFILKERVTSFTVGGIICIIIGLLTLHLNELQAFTGFQNQYLVGNILIVFSTLFWASDNTISKLILDKGTPILNLLYLKSLIGGAISLLIVIFLNISFDIAILDIPMLLFLSLGGFAGSLFLFMVGLRRVGAIRSVMIFATSSFFGLIFATTVLGERNDMLKLGISLGFMFVGIFLITRENA
jgi:drug/metabolite transporter (DMT)-like permease